MVQISALYQVAYKNLQKGELIEQNYKPTPNIILERLWLEELGFIPREKMSVRCEGGKLTVTLKNDYVVE